MRRFLVIIGILLLLSASVGWWRASLATLQGQSQTDIWSEPRSVNLDSAALKAMVKRVQATELLKLSRKDEEKREEAAGKASEVEVDNNRPKFPKIVAAFQRNNVSHVTLMSDDNVMTEVKAGDSLTSGWLIKSVDLRQVIAVFEDEEERFVVRPYLETAFDKPEESAETDETISPNEGGEN